MSRRWTPINADKTKHKAPLRYLRSSAFIGGLILLSLLSLRAEHTVDLRASWVTDSDMARLARMQDLRRLDLSLTRVSDRGLRALKTAPNIEELNLYFAEKITDEGASVVKNWKHLRKLNLRGTKITDSTLEILAGIPTLEWLDVGWAETTDTGFDHLAALTNLKWLTMGGNKLTDGALQVLRQLPQLEYLDIGGQQRTDSGLWSLLLSETGMESIASVTELRELRLEGRNVTTRGLELLKPLAKLERLDLQACKRLRDDAATVLASMQQLKALDLKDSSLSAEAVAKIRAALPSCDVRF